MLQALDRRPERELHARRGNQWRKQLADWEEASGIPPGISCWTSQSSFQGRGLVRADRVMHLIDAVCAQKLMSSKYKLCKVKEHQIKEVMSSTVVDFSQNPVMRPYTRNGGLVPCLTSTSKLYCYGRDRVISAREQFALQGWKCETLLCPEELSEAKLKDLAGQGMCVGNVGAILWALFCVHQFPG